MSICNVIVKIFVELTVQFFCTIFIVLHNRPINGIKYKKNCLVIVSRARTYIAFTITVQLKNTLKAPYYTYK